ncbi:YbjN domain-containing protein [Sulfuriferula thiophila]|uniref:YbjN domain-containing protein n=1 Tax=Sulfuriferula thiophila TaxID=1781211 RepID=UPI000F614912|nr:YbjN domain-containing protein [Sulfuriferula thiophila]
MNLIDIAQACLDDMHLPATRVPNLPVINLPIENEDGKLNMFIHSHEEAHRVFVYTRPQDLLVPIERIGALADFLTRANYGLPLGNFEIDMNDGEMNFKNSLDISDGVLTTKMVQTLIVFSLECMNRYLPGIRAVIAGAEPKTAIETIDGPTKVVIK